jgi:hypothetical protein
MLHVMDRMELIGAIVRGVRQYGYVMQRSRCGRYWLVDHETSDGSCGRNFLYDDLKAALRAWHWVRG